MGLDPILLVSLGIGAVAGRLAPSRGPWPARATVVVVFLLLLFLGTSLGAASNASLLAAAPVGVALAVLTLTFTAIAALALRPASRAATRDTPPSGGAPWIGGAFAAAVVLGFVLERLARVGLSAGIEPLLWVLVAVVAYGLRWNGGSLRRVWAPLAAAIIGAGAAALVGAAVLGLPPSAAAATTGAFGFYSLAGPLVAARFGASIGFAAFLANFLRENLVIVSSPSIGRYLKGEGLAALGGATAMDTTLYFVTRYGDPDAGSLALATGLILTVVASVALPVLVALPGA